MDEERKCLDTYDQKQQKKQNTNKTKKRHQGAIRRKAGIQIILALYLSRSKQNEVCLKYHKHLTTVDQIYYQPVTRSKRFKRHYFLRLK